MLKPDVIQDTAKAAPDYGGSAREASAAGFLAGVPGMNVDASSNTANVVGTVKATGMQMQTGMDQVRGNLEGQLQAHQEMQRARRSFDYQPNMEDLRPTHAKGFPKEKPEEFYAPFGARGPGPK